MHFVISGLANNCPTCIGFRCLKSLRSPPFRARTTGLTLDETPLLTVQPGLLFNIMAMATPDDFVLISGLTSERWRKVNSCFGKVTASANEVGRVTVTPFSDGEEKPIPFDEANAVRLNLLNVTVLPNAFGNPWTCLYRKSLEHLVESRKVDFSFLPTRNSVRNQVRLEPSSKSSEVATNFPVPARQKMHHACSILGKHPELALKKFVELLHDAKEQGVKMFDSVNAHE